LLSPNLRLSDRHSQAEVLRERVKILVVVQQVIPALDAASRNYGIDGLANGYAASAQRSETSLPPPIPLLLPSLPN
jgi:hypothetical protein